MDNETRFARLSGIVQAVGIPVSADLENGLARTAEGVADNFLRALEAGCAGASLEDIADYSDPNALVFFDLEQASDRVRGVCESTKARDPDFVVTARTDYLLGPHEYSLSNVIERLVAFERAGADCLFAPGLRTLADVATVQSELSKPVNVLPMPGMTLDRLMAVGVQRVSLGSSLFRAAYKQIQTILSELDQEAGMDFMSHALRSEDLDKAMR
jgi:2-methylisocitrate lyase-like PEP mutase family enzyme